MPHTDHICYYVTSSKTSGAVFTGDTLFQGGCGRFFEGTADEMIAALDKLGGLPDETVVYNGHEYTAGNLKSVKQSSQTVPGRNVSATLSWAIKSRRGKAPLATKKNGMSS